MKRAWLLYPLGFCLFVSAAATEPAIQPPAEQTIGSNLEAFTNFKLTQPAPEGGLSITVTSDDPSKLLLAKGPEDAGSKSIVIKVSAQYAGTPDFCLQALAGSGTVTYTATAPGYTSAKGTVTLGPSGILVAGPFKTAEFKTTARTSAKITLYSALLDKTGQLVAQQPVAGGLKIVAKLNNSDAKVGIVNPTEVTFSGGEASGAVEFKPMGTGTTTLAVNVPPGFTAPGLMTNVKMTVELPGMGLTGEINLGKDLQVPGVVLLGEPAPDSGLDVTLTSEDPSKLVLSASAEVLGSKSVTIHVPPGDVRANYFVQGLSDSGSLSYTGSAPGYRSRVAPVTMAPSGIMIVYSPYGPPDEAEILRIRLVRDPRPFTMALTDKPAELTLWPAYLDPKTKRGADISAQRLRPGVTPTVMLENENPSVAKVNSKVTFGPAAAFATVDFTPLAVGKDVISIQTAPSGFIMPSNATSVTGDVTK